MSEVRIETARGELELYGDTSIALTMARKDVSEPLQFVYDYSKTITIPSTRKNKEVLGVPDNHNISSFDVNPKFNLDAQIIINGSIFKTGSIKLLNVVKQGNEVNEFELEFVDTMVTTKEKVENISLRDLDLSIYDHVKNKDNIKNSWKGTIKVNGQDKVTDKGEGYVYPLLDFGGRVGYNDWRGMDLKPAVFVKELWDRIFHDIVQLDYRSDFLDSDYFRSLIVPTVQREDLTDFQKRKRRARAVLGKNNHSGTPDAKWGIISLFDDSNWQTEFITENTTVKNGKVPFKEDNNNGVKAVNKNKFDPESNYDTSSYEYKASISGRYAISTEMEVVGVYYVPPDWDNKYTLNNVADFDNIRYQILSNSQVNNGETPYSQRPDGYVEAAVMKEDNNGNKIKVDSDVEEFNINTSSGISDIPAQQGNTVSPNLQLNLLEFAYAKPASGGYVNPDNVGAPTLKPELKNVEVYLNSGEKVWIEYKTKFYTSKQESYWSKAPESSYWAVDNSSGFAVETNIFGETGGGQYALEPFGFALFALDEDSVEEGNFINIEAAQERIVPIGGDFSISPGLPDVSCRDFIADIINMHNLYIIQDPVTKELIIEPFEEMFKRGKIRDWSDRIDFDADRTYEILPEISQSYKFTYSSGEDQLNKEYEEHYDKVYGEKEVTLNLDRNNNEEKLELTFVPTQSREVRGKYVPRILGTEDDNENIGYKRMDTSQAHILYFGGIMAGGWKLNADDVDGVSSEWFGHYPYAGHVNNPENPTTTLNFGIPRDVPFDTITKNNLFNKYHREWIKNITDTRAHLYKVDVILDEREFHELSLNDTIYVNGNTYIINRIVDMEVTDLTIPVEIELLHMPDFDTSQTQFEQVQIESGGNNVTDGPIDFNDDIRKEEEVDIGNYWMPLVPGTIINEGYTQVRKIQSNGLSESTNDVGSQFTNNTVRGVRNNLTKNVKDTLVKGNDNNIVGPSRNITVEGDNNKVESDVENVTIKGNNVTVKENVKNVAAIECDNTTISESNAVVYANNLMQDVDSGLIREFRELHQGGRNEVDNPFKVNKEDIVIGGRNAVRELGSLNIIHIINGGRDTTNPNNSDSIK